MRLTLAVQRFFSSTTTAFVSFLFFVLCCLLTTTRQRAFAQSFERTGRITGDEFDDNFRCSFLRGSLAYVGTFTFGGSVVKFNIDSRTHIKTAYAQNGEGYFFACTADPAGNFGYFGTYSVSNASAPASIVKFDLNQMTRVSAFQTPDEHGRLTAAEAVNSTHGLFASGTSPGKLLLVNFNNMRVDAVAQGTVQEFRFNAVLYDSATQYAYCAAQTSPGVVVKFDVPTMRRVGFAYGTTDEDQFQGAVLLSSTHAVFGCSTSPGRVVLMRLDTMARVASASANDGENRMWTGVASADGKSVFFGTGSATDPGKLVKFTLAAGNTGIAYDSSVAANSGEKDFFTSFRVGNTMWMGSGTEPGYLVSWNLMVTTTTLSTTSTTTTSTTTTATTTTPTTTRPTTTTATTTATTTTALTTTLPATTTATTAAATTVTTTTAAGTTFTTATAQTTVSGASSTTSTGTATPLATTTTATTATGASSATPSAPSSSTTTVITGTATTGDASSTLISSSQQPTSSATTAIATTAGTPITIAPTTSSSRVATSTTTRPVTTATAAATTAATTAEPNASTATPEETNPFENYTAPGLLVGTQEQLQTSVMATAVTAGLLAASPTVPMQMTRALAVFSLAGCPKASPEKSPWAQAPLSFPRTFFPGLTAGADDGGHARAAILGYMFLGVPVVLLACFIGWIVYKKKRVKKALARYKDRGPYRAVASFLVATAPVPYALGMYFGQIVAFWAQSSGLLSVVLGDGAFVDIVIMTAIPFALFAVLIYFYVRAVNAVVFAPIDAQEQLQISTTTAAATTGSDKQQRPHKFADPDQIGLVHSKFFVVPNAKEAAWLQKLKFSIAAWLRTPTGRRYVAGYFAWRRVAGDGKDDDDKKSNNKDDESSRAAAMDEGEVVLRAQDDDSELQSTQQGDQSERESATGASVTNNSVVSINDDRLSQSSQQQQQQQPAEVTLDVVEGAAGEASSVSGVEKKKADTAEKTTKKSTAGTTKPSPTFHGDMLTRYRSLLMKMVGPPLPGDEKHCKELIEGSQWRLKLAPFNFPAMAALAVAAAMAAGIAEGDMAKNCNGALVVIVVVNVLSALFTVLVRPFIVPARNVVAASVDVLIALSSVIALVVATSGEDSGIATVQVVTSVCVTVGAILELTLSAVRNFLFFVLGIKVVSHKENKQLQREYAAELAAMEEHSSRPLMAVRAEEPVRVSSPRQEQQQQDEEIELTSSAEKRIVAVESESDEESGNSDFEELNSRRKRQRRGKNNNDDDDWTPLDIHHERFIPPPSARLDLDLAEAQRRAACVAEQLHEGEERHRRATTPRNGGGAAAAWSTSSFVRTADASAANSPRSPLAAVAGEVSADSFGDPRAASPASLYLTQNMGTFRKQQEVALASLLYLMCNVFRKGKQQQQQNQSQQNNEHDHADL